MAHTSTSNKLSFSKGWYALNFVSMCIKNVQCLIFKYAFKSVSNLFRICVFPLFIKMFQPGNFIFGNSDIFSLLLKRIMKDFNILNYRDDTFSLYSIDTVGLFSSSDNTDNPFVSMCVWVCISAGIFGKESGMEVHFETWRHNYGQNSLITLAMHLNTKLESKRLLSASLITY